MLQMKALKWQFGLLKSCNMQSIVMSLEYIERHKVTITTYSSLTILGNQTTGAFPTVHIQRWHRSMSTMAIRLLFSGLYWLRSFSSSRCETNSSLLLIVWFLSELPGGIKYLLKSELSWREQSESVSDIMLTALTGYLRIFIHSGYWCAAKYMCARNCEIHTLRMLFIKVQELLTWLSIHQWEKDR